MLNQINSKKSVLLEKLADLVNKEFDKTESEKIILFLKKYYRAISYEDLARQEINKLYESLLSFWQFYSTREFGKPKIRIYNPEHSDQHKRANYTVIEIAQDNMPFLVDSIRIAVNRHGLLVNFMIYTGGISVVRNNKHEIIRVLSDKETDINSFEEAPIYLEISRISNLEEMDKLKISIEHALHDISIITKDSKKMRQSVIETVGAIGLEKSDNLEELDEIKDFLAWLAQDNFVIFGIGDFEVQHDKNAINYNQISSTSLGLYDQLNKTLIDTNQCIKQNENNSQLLTFFKTSDLSIIYRDVYIDCISIKLPSIDSKKLVERKIIGVFSEEVNHIDPLNIPYIRMHCKAVLAQSELNPSGYGAKKLKAILASLPRNDLFQAPISELFDIAIGILQLQERQRIRLFVRRDTFGRFYSCFVFVPRDRFNTQLRKEIQNILSTSLNAKSIQFVINVSESQLARMHFTVYVDSCSTGEINFSEIEQKIIEASTLWIDDFTNLLVDQYGDEQGTYYSEKYKLAFPTSYKEYFTPEIALKDLLQIELLAQSNPLELNFYKISKQDGSGFELRLKLFREDHSILMSEVLPMLENMGLLVIDECPHEISFQNSRKVWINDFEVIKAPGLNFELENIKHIFEEAFRNVWLGIVENDSFNKLVLSSKFSWRDAAIIRAYAKYSKQIGFTFSEQYIADSLFKNPEITYEIIQLFYTRFNPDKYKEQEANTLQDQIEKNILASLEKVTSLDQDRIIRHYVSLIKATIRTSVFQNNINYFSFKLNPELIPGLPEPFPMYEIFVYSPKFEGVHLRCGKIARGGIRWSDRREDFRTEVLGLMKAQQVKNAVIIPNGAKGGFVLKTINPDATKEELMQNGINCYKQFISGLLDITDNIVDQKITKPINVICHDENDPYLVVAADKGTATFSDIAKSLSKEYNFWLQDAFASGGSKGYDHKKLGITARGAWESVKRNFRALNMDVDNRQFTVVGIGDMSGDVFGNGMLLSNQIKLIAAFNHMHIFLDPNPDTAISFRERKRLFDLPRSTWADYDANCISEGGGIYSRSQKYIKLSKQVQDLFGISEETIEPNKLINTILKAQVDLLWNGGIGTYVKATSELNQNVGDRANDSIRVNGNELRCKTIGEGGNLGLTQLGRIEYSLNNGLIFTDFIDNSGGVDTSDHEVNMKILLNAVVSEGKLSFEERDQLIQMLTLQVVDLVLFNNYTQTKAISYFAARAYKEIETHKSFIQYLEYRKKLNRKLEYLPDDVTIQNRKENQKGLVAPEIAVLFAYSKNVLCDDIINSDIPESNMFTEIAMKEFPVELQSKFTNEIINHQLKRNIIATQISNMIVNEVGFTFVYKLQEETQSSVSDVAKAFVLAKHIFSIDLIIKQLNAMDATLQFQQYCAILDDINSIIYQTARWLLINRKIDLTIESTDIFLQAINKLKNIAYEILPEERLTAMRSSIDIQPGYIANTIALNKIFLQLLFQ